MASHRPCRTGGSVSNSLWNIGKSQGQSVGILLTPVLIVFSNLDFLRLKNHNERNRSCSLSELPRPCCWRHGTQRLAKLEKMMLVLTDLFAHSSMHLLVYSLIHFMSFHFMSCHVISFHSFHFMSYHVMSFHFISIHSFIHSFIHFYLLDWFMCFLVLYIQIYIYICVYICIYIYAHIFCLNRKAGTHHLCAPMAGCSTSRVKPLALKLSAWTRQAPWGPGWFQLTMMILPAKIVSFNQQRWWCLTGFEMGASNKTLPEHCQNIEEIPSLSFLFKRCKIYGRHSFRCQMFRPTTGEMSERSYLWVLNQDAYDPYSFLPYRVGISCC